MYRILVILMLIGFGSQGQNCFIEIDSKRLDETVTKDFPDCYDNKGQLKTVREYTMSYEEKDGKALVFIGHCKYGEKLRENITSKEEIEIWRKHFNKTPNYDEKIRNNYTTAVANSPIQ